MPTRRMIESRDAEMEKEERQRRHLAPGDARRVVRAIIAALPAMLSITISGGQVACRITGSAIPRESRQPVCSCQQPPFICRHILASR